ncbi:helix-turn-helix domain-containing protein [Nonomuraea typhae]|uniref:Helix-turn-helix domain-containing protein n=1 Tax=Nonomuraea typhae TaxID=2603600 RepID=A0ABW7YUQ1_9ACTN
MSGGLVVQAPARPGGRRVRSVAFTELFALPVVVSIATAAQVFGISSGTAYKLVGRGEFPCTVLRLGRQYRVSLSSLMRALDIADSPVYMSDVERGARFVRGVA